VVFRNPIPVGVAIQPVGAKRDLLAGKPLRLLAVRRAIEPQKGGVALPGGFHDFGESWQRNICRELEEELGVITEPSWVTLFDYHSTPNGSQNVVFGLLPAIREEDLPPFAANREVAERLLIDESDVLCFSTHQSVAAAYFRGRR
jgi:ADP-ribose pyrophosphatase YjhB (NUDIX family)